MNNDELGIYIHIPFCKEKCFYCDFISYSKKETLIDKYIKSLIKEIKVSNSLKKEKITTIYIGGGTPSYLDSSYIEEILETIKNKYKIEKSCEITIEVNPGTCTKEKFKSYKKIGINRLSIGLQSTENKILKELGRIHTYEEFLETYTLAQKEEYKNINIDLMIGLPKQTIVNLKKELKEIINLNPTHISVYSLIVEAKTKMEQLINDGILELPNEKTERAMYWYIKKQLELKGYIHYEISNFAKKGYESKHNMNCWKQKQYIGFGVAAHSFYNNIRYSNINNIEKYIENIKENTIYKNKIIQEKLNIEDEKKEYMLLGLRTLKGVNISKFKQKFIENPIFIFKKELDKLISENLLIIDDNYIQLTNKGLDFANLVWEEFI